MKRDNTAIILNFRALRRLLKQGDDVTREIDDTIAEINGDTDHSDSWKAGKLEKARNLRNSELRKLGSDAMSVIEQIDKEIAARRDYFDHRDSDFQAALATLQFYGKATPYEVQKSIVDSMLGNYQGLRALKTAFEANDLPTDSITQTIGILDSMGVTEANTISEFVSYAASDLATNNEWRVNNLRSMLDRYEKALDIDSSRNPLSVRLDNLISDPNTSKYVRERAETWRNAHSEALDDDDQHVMDMTMNRLAAWEHGEAAPQGGN